MRLANYTKEFNFNLKLAYPVMLGQLGHVLVGLADNVMVGRLGAIQLAAVSLGNSVVFIALSIGIGFTFAITPLIAEADSSKNIEKGRLDFQHGLLLSIVLGVVMFILLLLGKPLLNHMNQPPEVVKLALPYMGIIAFSIIPLMIFQASKQFADGLSQTKHAMHAAIFANIINIVVNYFLIYGIWIFPRLELIGAGIGTLFSRIAMVAFMWYILNTKPKFIPYIKLLSLAEIQKEKFKKIISLGFPTAMQMFFEVAVFTAAVWLSGTLGVIDQAANQIALNLASMTFMIAVGMGVAATIRVGNQKGLEQYIELRRIALSIFLQIFLIEFVFAIGFLTLKNYLPLVYIDNWQVIKTASTLLIVAGFFQISDGVQVVVLGALRGLQDVKIPTYITFIAYWIVGFPISFFLGKTLGLGSQGIWIGLLSGLTASALLLYLRFDYLTKKLIHSNHGTT
ncbi:MAG: MATE family efflux transporter [Flavobacteriales bacterium CG_4_9_14_0_2_um_filter_35_242]|nr:MATE family efflux transporter [Zetaproteobacteria bacterium]NDK17935.1 MATE family efflux transporter [Flavobacteriales bacterium]OIO12329.1 MAG: MATE family efflux transporter [Flavobacteriaceae bacterium CG1_02_35_72]PIR12420.1 MAG: MATE family efflux transporter [Flavobacteriales bacterium CG11_big_fil_rev_8_21_14_0_20_35_7]PIV17385.1 MAG: MATE family efflux transporter [Flavobacteriales bacterium CG03_land_8_20_14_0_80_35_15]PIX07748.1 MAG: MATE family efflux transporter [Flavobacteria